MPAIMLPLATRSLPPWDERCEKKGATKLMGAEDLNWSVGGDRASVSKHQACDPKVWRASAVHVYFPLSRLRALVICQPDGFTQHWLPPPLWRRYQPKYTEKVFEPVPAETTASAPAPAPAASPSAAPETAPTVEEAAPTDPVQPAVPQPVEVSSGAAGSAASAAVALLSAIAALCLLL